MVETGQIAVVHYTARLADDGTVMDTTDVDTARREGIYHANRDYKPLEFRVGDDDVVPALTDAVRELEAAGDSTTVLADPAEAFGERSASKVETFPRDVIEERTDGSIESETLVTTADGQSGWITDVTDDTVVVDFNHELAGKRLEIDVDLLDVHGKPGEESARNWEKKAGRRRE
ncbi:FKBP-type peptidyl-prolyl cis-trans isomerase [Natronolimnohabitans sp. A-GB9]|uniref:FKBP-type peptidyl-prolyl cis-trans isomerase n=1 Tax=Natronolimnohabitans sp. A-GB9 TaxID=3069757 RepID=UPI0027B43C6F|nr:FKBP-type peptidyl-prolyl cis-trans isomerase [Natronolimnohabitans sp. A-GB9]MDQ2050709.1 FKBP-type peptidyl-prolyl cis-trans isomerase [Natronolimnohabitans sp. A-GB9]